MKGRMRDKTPDGSVSAALTFMDSCGWYNQTGLTNTRNSIALTLPGFARVGLPNGWLCFRVQARQPEGQHQRGQGFASVDCELGEAVVAGDASKPDGDAAVIHFLRSHQRWAVMAAIQSSQDHAVGLTAIGQVTTGRPLLLQRHRRPYFCWRVRAVGLGSPNQLGLDHPLLDESGEGA